MNTFIPYTRPSITELEVAYTIDAVRNGWGAKCYEYIDKFENALKSHFGAAFAIATSSCTGALHMGLHALGVGPGDEVILADTGWIATVAPIVHLGAKPVFVDILADTWCVDPSLVEKAITTHTKAIIAVHLYGNVCDMSALLKIGERYGIPIIEDAAEAVGSYLAGRPVGSFGKFGTFSFHGTKTMTTGEGGAFITNDPNLYEHVLTLSNHGRSRSQKQQFFPDMIGFKYKMSNVQAAIGCAQLERIECLTTRKREILAYYRQALRGECRVSLNPETPNGINGSWMPTVVFAPETGIDRDALRSAFTAARIDARVFFHPLSSLPMFKGFPRGINAWEIARRAFNLPSYHDMTSADQDRVIEVIRALLSVAEDHGNSATHI